MNAVVNSVIAQLTSEDGSFDYAQFKEVMKELSNFRVEHKAELDAALKAIKDAGVEDAKVLGEAYYKTLSKGSAISWNTSEGIKTGVVAENKAGAKTAHVVIDGLPARSSVEEGYEGKFGDRYVKWEKIVVPADFELETKEEVVA